MDVLWGDGLYTGIEFEFIFKIITFSTPVKKKTKEPKKNRVDKPFWPLSTLFLKS
jgi:hypothetical protein